METLTRKGMTWIFRAVAKMLPVFLSYLQLRTTLRKMRMKLPDWLFERESIEERKDTLKKMLNRPQDIHLGVVMKKKKKISFFKVILILGALIALAIYILDRILPKPYSDEDLDDAWEDDDDFDVQDEGDAEETTPPPTVDETYDVNQEDETEDEKAEKEEPEKEK